MVKLPNKKAFTLVELMIVMMITGVLMGLMWRGLAVLQREYTLQTQAEGLQEVLRDARNRAFTSAMENGSGGGMIRWAYGYVLRFDDDGYGTYKMVEGLELNDLNDATLEAYWISQDWQEGGELIEQNTSLETTEVINECGQIGFSSVNGRMLLSGGAETCEVMLTLGGANRILELNSVTGDILIR